MSNSTEFVYSSSDAVSLTRKLIHARHQQSAPGSTFGTSLVDEHVIPMQPGDLVVVCGRPGNGKSLIIRHLLYKATQEILAKGPDTKEATVLVSWEESVEQVTAYWLAVTGGYSATDMFMGKLTRYQLDDLETTITKVGTWPLYIIGLSSQRGTDGKRRRRLLTTDAVSDTLDYLMNDMGLDPRMIAADYLQRIPKAGRIDDVPHFSGCVDWAKDTGLQAGCPFILGSQSGRDLDKSARHHLPRLSDSQYTSNAEQSADKFYGVWMPKQTHAMNDRIEIGNLPALTVTPNLLLLGLMKQKYGPAPIIFPMYVTPEHMGVRDMDTLTQKPIADASGLLPEPKGAGEW